LPFTLLHLGPALALGVPFRSKVHAPTFIIANLIVDIEPFIIIMLNLSLPLHWFFHSIAGALILGAITSIAMYVLKERFSFSFIELKLEVSNYHSFKEYFVGEVLGTIIHVMLDYSLYSDIKPLYPLNYNPLYNPLISCEINLLCIFLLIVGLIEYLLVFIKAPRTTRTLHIRSP